MSIRPVDLQIMVQKSPDVNRTQSNEAHHASVGQQQTAANFQKEVRHQSEQVQTANKSEQNNVDAEGRGGNGYSSSKKRNKRERKEDKDNPKPASTSMFDVTI